VHRNNILGMSCRYLPHGEFLALQVLLDFIAPADKDNFEHPRLRDGVHRSADIGFYAFVAACGIERDANRLAPLLEFLFPARRPAGCVKGYSARPISPCPWISS